MTVRSTYKWLRQQNDDESARELATILDAILSQINDTEGLMYTHDLAPDNFFSKMLDNFLAKVLPVMVRSVTSGRHGLSFYLELTPEQMITELQAALDQVDQVDAEG